MDDSEKNYEYVKSHIVSPKRRFTFHCDGCGKCCENRDDIILSAWDLYRMTVFLKRKDTLDFMREFCVVIKGQHSNLPVCLLKSVGYEQRCPFLMKNKKCKVHKVKPSVCALFPLGRVYNGEIEEVQYMLQDIDCGFNDKSQSVQEWLDAFQLEQTADTYKKWSAMLFELMRTMNKVQDSLTEETLQILWNAVFIHLYFYVPERPFEIQLDEHRNEIKQLCGILNSEKDV